MRHNLRDSKGRFIKGAATVAKAVAKETAKQTAKAAVRKLERDPRGRFISTAVKPAAAVRKDEEQLKELKGICKCIIDGAAGLMSSLERFCSFVTTKKEEK